MNPSGHAIQSELEIQYCHVLCPKPHGWNPAWHAQSRGTAATSPWTNPSHGFCPEAASSSPKGRNFSLHYTRRVLNTEMSPKITDTKQHLLDWHSSYSKSSVGRATLDPLLNANVSPRVLRETTSHVASSDTTGFIIGLIYFIFLDLSTVVFFSFPCI